MAPLLILPSALARDFRWDMTTPAMVLVRLNPHRLKALDMVSSGAELGFSAVVGCGVAMGYETATCDAGGSMRDLSEDLRADRDVVLAAVSRNGFELQYAADALQSDKTIALVSVRENGLALRYVGPELRADREVVLAAVQHSGSALRYAGEGPRADHDVVMAAVSNCGTALPFACTELRADKAVVLAACHESGLALRTAAEHLRADRSVVLVAVRQDGLALNYAPALQDDLEIVRAAVAETTAALCYASPALRADPEFSGAMAALQSDEDSSSQAGSVHDLAE